MFLYEDNSLECFVHLHNGDTGTVFFKNFIPLGVVLQIAIQFIVITPHHFPLILFKNLLTAFPFIFFTQKHYYLFVIYFYLKRFTYIIITNT